MFPQVFDFPKDILDFFDLKSKSLFGKGKW